MLIVSVAVMTTISINAEENDEIIEESASGITVYYKCETCVPYIYYWNALPTNLETTYPGVKMTLDTSQGSNWYKYTFSNITKINLLFTNGTNSLSGQLCEEQTRTSGDWWFKNGKWRNSNPEKTDPYDSCDMREDSIYFVITTRFYDW